MSGLTMTKHAVAWTIFVVALGVILAILIHSRSTTKSDTNPDLNPYWIKQLSHHNDPKVRRTAAAVLSHRLSRLSSLEQSEQDVVVRVLRSALDDKNAAVRFQAISGLRNQEDIGGIAKKMMDDEDENVRSLAQQLSTAVPPEKSLREDR